MLGNGNKSIEIDNYIIDKKMRRSLHVTSVLLTAILLLSSLPSFAANRYKSWYKPTQKVNHLVTAGASIGYSTLLENYDDLITTGSVGGTV